MMRGLLGVDPRDRRRRRRRADRDRRDRQPRQERRDRPGGEYAQSVCGAVGTWRGEMEAIVEEIRSAERIRHRGGAEPQSETPQGRRTGFVRTGLERGVQATQDPRHGHRQRRRSGLTAGARRRRSSVSDWADSAVDDLETAQDSLDEEADTLEEAIKQLTGAAAAIGSVLTSGVTDVRRRRPPRPGARQPLSGARAPARSFGEEQSLHEHEGLGSRRGSGPRRHRLHRPRRPLGRDRPRALGRRRARSSSSSCSGSTPASRRSARS